MEDSQVNPEAIVRVYNFPWSGKIHPFDCCIFCGNFGSSYQISSKAGRCLNPNCKKNVRDGAKPIPELLEKAEKLADKLTREWCLKNFIDYEATVKNFKDKLGEQEVPRRVYDELKIQGKILLDVLDSDERYIVYLDKSEIRKIDAPFEPSKYVE